jgi:hypothetical protein
MRTDGRVELLATALDGVLMSGISAETEARSLLRLLDQHDGSIPPEPPMTFRLVAKDGEWQVHTAVRPSEGLEVTFTVGIPV